MTPQEIFDLLTTGGALAAAVLIIYGFLSERIVPHGRLDEQRSEKREAMELARTAISSIERNSDLIELAIARLDEAAREMGRRRRA